MAGGDRRLREVLRAIAPAYECVVFTSERGRQYLAEEPELSEIEYALHPNETDGLVSSYIRRAIWASKEVRRRGFDDVYGSSDFFPDVYPAYQAARKGAKWVQCVMHMYPSLWWRPGSKVRALIGGIAQLVSIQLSKRLAAGWIVLNGGVKDSLVKKGVPGDKVTVNGCGVDLGGIESMPRGREGYDACYLGRISHTKGVFDLVEIWQEVVKLKADARLCMIGGGDEELRRQLGQRLEEAGLADRVVLKGFLKDEEMYGILKASKVFVFPSHEEGFGIAIAEAMACGLPPVAWDLAVYSECFGPAVTTIEEGDVRGFARAACDLLDNDDHRSAKSREALDQAARLGWKPVRDKELEILDDLLSLS